jgi:hypothetical protein
MIITMRMRWAGNVVRIGRREIQILVYSFGINFLNQRRCLEGLGVAGRTILKWALTTNL